MADLFFHETFAGSFGENDWTNRSNSGINDQYYDQTFTDPLDKNDRFQPKRLPKNTKRLLKNDLFLTKRLLKITKRLTVRLEKTIGRYI
jgi:hypothetical protein